MVEAAGHRGLGRPAGAEVAGWRVWGPVYLAVAAVTLAAHLPEIGGWVSCNPIYRYGGMVLSPPHHVLPGLCVIDYNDGITLQALGGHVANMWLHGRIPWWDSYAGLGLPLAAEAQPAAFFLPFILLLHFTAGLLILKITMQMLAGACVVALLRELRIGRPGAALSGMLFALNGTFAWVADSPILPVAFMPALLFALERCRARAEARRPGGPVWVALALAYSLVAGFPETAFMNGVLGAAWAAIAIMRTLPGRRMALVRKIACGGLAGLALSAPAWVSFLDYLRISSVGIHELVIGNHLAADQAAVLLIPSIYGPPYSDWKLASWTDVGGYFGPALGMLALVGVFSGRRLASVRWLLAGWIAFWLSVFFGAPVAHAIWAAVPPFNQVQVTRYAMPSLECATVVLAALTVEDWRSEAPLRTAYAVLAFAASTVVTLTFGAHAGRLSFGAGPSPGFHVMALFEACGVVCTLAWLLAAPALRWRLLTLAALVAADACGNFIVPELAGTTPNRLALAPLEFLQKNAGFARTFALNEQLPTNYGAWFGVAEIQADSMPFAGVWNDAAMAIGGDVNMNVTSWLVITPAMQLTAMRSAMPRLRAAAVRYFVVAAAHDPFATNPEPGLVRVFSDARTRIYELTDAASYAEARGGSCGVIIVSREEMHTSCSAPAVLLRRELLIAGWHASVNGRKSAVTPGSSSEEGYFQQVSLPAGPADVRWWYAPPHARTIAALWGLGVVSTLGMAVSGLRARTRG